MSPSTQFPPSSLFLALPCPVLPLPCPALPYPTLLCLILFAFCNWNFLILFVHRRRWIRLFVFVVPALTKFVERESCRIYFLLLLLLRHSISIAFVAFHEPKALRLRLCSKNFASAAILHCKARATQIGLLDWRRKESFWIDGMNECIRGQGDKEDPHEGNRLRNWGWQREMGEVEAAELNFRTRTLS